MATKGRVNAGDGIPRCEYKERRVRTRREEGVEKGSSERALARLVEHHLSLRLHLSIAVAPVKSHRIFRSDSALAARYPLRRSEWLVDG